MELDECVLCMSTWGSVGRRPVQRRLVIHMCSTTSVEFRWGWWSWNWWTTSPMATNKWRRNGIIQFTTTGTTTTSSPLLLSTMMVMVVVFPFCPTTGRTTPTASSTTAASILACQVNCTGPTLPLHDTHTRSWAPRTTRFASC